MTWLTKLSRSILSLGFIALSLQGIILLQQQRLRNFTHLSSLEDYRQQEKQLAINLTFVDKIPSFGFSNLIADWSYLQFIQYFGDTEAREKVGYALIPQYFKLLVQQDPKFMNAYVQLSPACSIFAGRPDLTVTFMNQALSAMSPQSDPDAYYLWFYKGLDELLFLGNMIAAQNSYQTASKWARLNPSGDSEKLAKTADDMSRFLKQNPDSRRLRIGSWMLIYQNTRDQRVKDYVIAQIRDLGGDVIVSTQNGGTETRVIMPPSH